MKTAQQRFRKAVRRRLRQRVGKRKGRQIWDYNERHDYYLDQLDYRTSRELAALMIDDYDEGTDIIEQITDEYWSVADAAAPAGSLAWLRHQLKLATEQYQQLTELERNSLELGKGIFDKIKALTDELKAVEETFESYPGPRGYFSKTPDLHRESHLFSWLKLFQS